jgi:hypothetical protein
MMSPLKYRSSEGNRFWSVWVESTSNDVECTFGILNRRWRFEFVERYNREATAMYFLESQKRIRRLSEWILPMWTKVCHLKHFYVSMGSSYKSTHDTTYYLIFLNHILWDTVSIEGMDCRVLILQNIAKNMLSTS